MFSKKISMSQKQNLTGWLFLLPASLLIAWMSFYPMFQSLMLSMQTGAGAKMKFADSPIYNYARMLSDKVFLQTMGNTFLYLLVEVPVMLILALILASMLNNPNLRFKGVFRTAIFLPCATSLVGYAMIFRTLFAIDGFVNTVLVGSGILSAPYNWLGEPDTARFVIIIALIWRWTGYNMVFYLAGLQNIEYSIYEAARIDGASSWHVFWKITVPLLKPVILLTAIMSTNGTLQMFDESWNLTKGGPANATKTMSHYLYDVSFVNSPNFGYAAALSYVIFFMVAILAFIQMKAGDKR